MEKMDLARRTSFIAEELEALFKFIPSPQLLKFRQVSKEWEDVAEMVLGKRRDVELILTTDNFDSKTNWDFLQFLNDSPENVFVAPVLHIKNTSKSVPVQNFEKGITCVTFKIIGEICKRLGNRGIIRKLIIEDGKNAPDFPTDFILVLLSLLPSLETLDISKRLQFFGALTSEQTNSKLQLPSLKQIKFGGADMFGCNVKETASLVKILLESSPNLENITDTDRDREPGILNLIGMLKDTGRLAKIKGVTITKPEELDILLQCQPKLVLHSLTIQSKDVVDSKKLFSFLQEQADNLKTFICNGNSLVPKSILTLPVLPVLEQISFKALRSGCLLSANYGKDTPALKTLEISSWDNFTSWEELICYEISSEMPPCLSLEKLGLLVTDLSSERMFDKWENLFPNLKGLGISMEENGEFDFGQANKCWPNLEELKLKIETGFKKHNFEFKDLDEIVFGIGYVTNGIEIDKTEEEWWMKIPAPEINGTVANLKNLQKLEVAIEGFGGIADLTDYGVYFGLGRMQSLKEIAFFTNYKGPEMKDVSKEAFQFLVKNLPKLEKLHLMKQKWKRGEILK